jgi:hypothetical protein
MRPYFIEQRFKLRTPIYSETASYGHMGRESKVVTKTFNNAGPGSNDHGEALPLGGAERAWTWWKAFKL